MAGKFYNYGFLPSRKHLWISLPFFVMLQKSFRMDVPLLDFWWHLKMGEIILTEHVIPRLDQFSFTAHGKLYIVQNWLSEIIFWSVYKSGGLEALIVFNSLIFLAILIIIYWTSIRVSRSVCGSVFAAVLFAICIPCNLRPQIFSFLLFALFYWFLRRHNSEDGKRIYWLPIMMIAWVNLHGAFILGLVLIAIFLFVEFIKFRMERGAGYDTSSKRVVVLGAIFILTTGASLINPEGYSVYAYIQTVVNDTSSQLFVTEWQPPAINTVAGVLLFYLPFFLTMMSLILSRNKPKLIDLTLFMAFAVFALTAVRNCAWFQMVSVPILALYLPAVPWVLLTGLWRTNTFQKSWFRLSANSDKRMGKVNLGVVGLLFFLLLIRSPWWRSHRNHDSLMDIQTPVAVAEYIHDKKLKGNIFHHQIYGDYILWRLWPNQRVFFDGRVHLYGEEFVQNYFRIQNDSDWEARLKGYHIRYILLAKEDKGRDEKGFIGRVRRSSGWKILYEDEKSILWEKIQPDNILG